MVTINTRDRNTFQVQTDRMHRLIKAREMAETNLIDRQLSMLASQGSRRSGRHDSLAAASPLPRGSKINYLVSTRFGPIVGEIHQFPRSEALTESRIASRHLSADILTKARTKTSPRSFT